MSCGNDRTNVLMNLHQLSFPAQDLLMIKPVNILFWNRKGFMSLHSQLESYEQLMSYGEGTHVFMGVAPVDETPFNGCPQIHECVDSTQWTWWVRFLEKRHKVFLCREVEMDLRVVRGRSWRWLWSKHILWSSQIINKNIYNNFYYHIAYYRT